MTASTPTAVSTSSRSLHSRRYTERNTVTRSSSNTREGFRRAASARVLPQVQRREDLPREIAEHLVERLGRVRECPHAGDEALRAQLTSHVQPDRCRHDTETRADK